MKPLKCFAWQVWCTWNGHEPIIGTFFSRTYWTRMPCMMCKHCYKVLGAIKS